MKIEVLLDESIRRWLPTLRRSFLLQDPRSLRRTPLYLS